MNNDEYARAEDDVRWQTRLRNVEVVTPDDLLARCKATIPLPVAVPRTRAVGRPLALVGAAFAAFGIAFLLPAYHAQPPVGMAVTWAQTEEAMGQVTAWHVTEWSCAKRSGAERAAEKTWFTPTFSQSEEWYRRDAGWLRVDGLDGGKVARALLFTAKGEQWQRAQTSKEDIRGEGQAPQKVSVSVPGTGFWEQRERDAEGRVTRPSQWGIASVIQLLATEVPSQKVAQLHAETRLLQREMGNWQARKAEVFRFQVVPSHATVALPPDLPDLFLTVYVDPATHRVLATEEAVQDSGQTEPALFRRRAFDYTPPDLDRFSTERFAQSIKEIDTQH